MGNRMDGGFHQLPRVYLRNLRKKTDRRFRTATATQEVIEVDTIKKQKNHTGTQLNAMVVSEYIISNPDFLDDLVKKHISQDRVRAWIREPTQEVSEDPDLRFADDVNDEVIKIVPIDASDEVSSETIDPEGESRQVEDSKSIETEQSAKKHPSVASAGRKNKNSRGDDSTFRVSLQQKGERRLKLLMLNRSRLVFPFRHSSDELSELIETSLADVSFDEMESHLFPYTEIYPEDISKVFIKMSTSLLGKYGFPVPELCHFLTTLRANYLDVEYHNFGHALSHAQSMFWILKDNPGVFTELEMKCLLVSSLGHDVGHPGLNSAFLKEVGGGMQKMYDDPILENHHAHTCLLILQEIKCNVFCDLDTHDYKQVVDDLRHAILSTEVRGYRAQCERMRQILNAGINMEKRNDRQCVKSLLMMSCDLCSAWKRWDEHRNVTWSLYKEFFNQGDKEREFGLSTSPFMMRTNADNIPKYQTSFLEETALPIFRLLATVFPSVAPAVQSTEDNLDCWKTYG